MAISVTVELTCGCKKEVGSTMIVKPCAKHPACVGGGDKGAKSEEARPAIPPPEKNPGGEVVKEPSPEAPESDAQEADADSMIIPCLSLHRPWGYAIFGLPEGKAKRIENRSRPYKALLKAPFVALHHAEAWDEEGAAYIEKVTGKKLPKGILADTNQTGVLGVVTFTEIIERQSFEGHFRRDDPWFFGPFGHIMANVKAFREAIPCKGKQMIPFRLPDKVVERVRAEMKK